MSLIREHDLTTPEGQMAFVLDRLQSQVTQTYRNLKNGGKAISDFIFTHPTFTAQQICDAMGNTPDRPIAAGLMAAARGTAEILTAVSGRQQRIEIPNARDGRTQRVEISQDNVVTIVTE